MSELTTEANPFSEIITADAVRDILTKQVAKAREGDTAAASLVLKIAMAKSGQNRAPRRNPEAPIQKAAITRGQLLAILSQESLSAQTIADRTGCTLDSITVALDGDRRFTCDIRGRWSLEKVRLS